MADGVGELSRWPQDGSDRFLLTLPDGTCELVGGELSDEDVAARFGLDRVVHMPDLDICPASHLDGPLAGTHGYARDILGYRMEFALPPRPGGPRGVYEVVTLATDDRPAGLRFVGYLDT